MLDIKEIASMENVMQPLVDKVNSYPYVVYYGLGFDLKFFWKNYLEWFGRPTAIIDRATKNGGVEYEGIPLFSAVTELQDDILKNSVVLITVPSVCEEVYTELTRYIEIDRIVKHPTLLTYSSKSFRNFIAEHAELIVELYDALEDEESKKVFEDWLKGKVTCDIAYFCRNCIPNNYVNTSQVPIELLRRKGYSSDLYYRKERGRQISDDSVFRTGILKYTDKEVYFDCGAAHGDTYQGFVSAVNGKYKNIVLFEPEDSVYEELKSLVGESSGVQCMKCGVSDENSRIFTGATSGLGGVIINGTAEETVGESIILRTIDSVSEELQVIPTLIKMDVEGAELAALKGAKKTISTAKPKLAICIYHKDEDLIEIPQYIHSLNPEYRMYVRHFDCSPSQLVLYCV